MTFSKFSTAAVAAIMAMGSAAYAAPVVYSGYDSGAGAGSLAGSPLAVAARAAFDAATSGGSMTTIDFDGNNSGASFSALNVRSNSGCPAHLCGYNTTTGGSKFHLQSGGSQTITFDNAVDSFGAYFTGWQVGGQTITYTDGNSVTLNMPGSGNGGTVFFGFVDAGASIASVTYRALNDIVSIDDVTFGNSTTAPVPLPAGGLLLLTAVGGFAAMRRKKA